jgi:enamine deaminase RidA (YjgF/YER057c/UK114 family)
MNQRPLAPLLLSIALAIPVAAQTKVEHIQPNASAVIADAVWAGDTLYVSGQLADPLQPGGSDYGNTQTQALSVLKKIEGILAKQGLGMKDVVKMTVFLAGDPANGGKLDFAGLQASYTQFFGTKEQPMKPARSAMQVAALVRVGALVEIEVIAVRGRR